MIKLIAKDNQMYTPFDSIIDEWMKQIYTEPTPFETEGDRDPILITRNEWGEPMTPKWKDGKVEDKYQDGRYVLAQALFDARETGQISDVKEVKLPDDSVFIIDDELYAGEQRRKEKK
jgi:hypothetical protein